MSVLLTASLIAAGCGDDDEETAETAAPAATTAASDGGGTEGEGDGEGAGGGGEDIQVGLVYDIGGRGDQSFNDAAARGLEQAVQEFGVQPEELEPAAGGENREELLTLLAEQGFPLIFGVGFLFQESVEAASGTYPDTTYAIVDAVVDADNVASLTFAEEQGSFLVGAAAALKSTTNRVGFIGGVETELLQKFEAGFVAGAKHVKPDIQVDVAYITQPPDFGGFNDPARGREIALGMYGGGADVIYAAAGGSGTGVFQAASEVSGRTGTKVWGIGVDSDQYNLVEEPLKPFVLTSMLKRVDVAVYETIRAYVEDGSAPSQVFDLESEGVGYATSGGFVDDIASQLDDLGEQIIAGEIEVPSTP